MVGLLFVCTRYPRSSVSVRCVVCDPRATDKRTYSPITCASGSFNLPHPHLCWRGKYAVNLDRHHRFASALDACGLAVVPPAI